MNSAQIESCLTDIYGTDVTNTWIDMTKVACIYLDQDSNLYPDKKHVMFYFDTSDKILKVRTGKIVNREFVFDSETPNHLIAFDAIGGFIQSSKLTDVGQVEYVS